MQKFHLHSTAVFTHGELKLLTQKFFFCTSVLPKLLVPKWVVTKVPDAQTAMPKWLDIVAIVTRYNYMYQEVCTKKQ